MDGLRTISSALSVNTSNVSAPEKPTTAELLNESAFLSICISGFLFGLVGLTLYFARPLPRYSPYLLTLPPTAVASYVFVVNFFKVHNGIQLPPIGDVILEIIYGTVATMVMFVSFTLIQIPIIWGIINHR